MLRVIDVLEIADFAVEESLLRGDGEGFEGGGGHILIWLDWFDEWGLIDLML